MPAPCSTPSPIPSPTPHPSPYPTPGATGLLSPPPPSPLAPAARLTRDDRTAVAAAVAAGHTSIPSVCAHHNISVRTFYRWQRAADARRICTPLADRLQCVRDVQSGRLTVQQAVNDRGVSKRTYYRWVAQKDQLVAAEADAHERDRRRLSEQSLDGEEASQKGKIMRRGAHDGAPGASKAGKPSASGKRQRGSHSSSSSEMAEEKGVAVGVAAPEDVSAQQMAPRAPADPQRRYMVLTRPIPLSPGAGSSNLEEELEQKHKRRIVITHESVSESLVWYEGAITEDIKHAIRRKFSLPPNSFFTLQDSDGNEVVVSQGLPSGNYEVDLQVCSEALDHVESKHYNNPIKGMLFRPSEHTRLFPSSIDFGNSTSPAMAGQDGGGGGSSGGGGGGGRAGFLFGNIDRRGRLDEDYMDDDAKDTIDNVGSKVVQADRDLHEITQALPQKSGVQTGGSDDDDDDDYDEDEQAPQNDDGKVDYFDENEEVDDEMGDEQARGDFAALALRNAERAKAGAEDDDDEDYDEDNEEETKEVANPTKASATDTDPAPPTDPALLEQRRLMEQARLAALAAKSGPQNTTKGPDSNVDGEDSENGEDGKGEPLHFSQLFSQPLPKLRYRPKRKRYGVAVDHSLQPPQEIERDDADVLEKEESQGHVDAVKIVLALDAENARARGVGLRDVSSEEAEESEKTEVDGEDEDLDAEEDEEFADAAAPLVAGANAYADSWMGKTAIERFDMVQQTSWEDDIVWRDEEGEEGEDSVWYAEDGDPDVEEDDDEDEFEDAVVMNVDSAPQVQQVAEEKADGSDDDMEWEDGNEAAANDADKAKSVEKPVVKSADLEKSSVTRDGENKIGAGDAKRTEDEIPSQTEKVANVSVPTETKSGDVVTDKREQDKLHDANPSTEPESEIARAIIAPNRDLEAGAWVEDIAWDSNDEERPSAGASRFSGSYPRELRMQFARLILDMNDPNMIFEHLSDASEKSLPVPRSVDVRKGALVPKAKAIDLVSSPGTQIHQLLEADRFNISQDIYYASGASNFMKVDRRSILRGLQNAPPAVKCLTTKTVLTEAELLSFRRPFLNVMPAHSKPMKILPFRRKRPKGGHAQIAGQIPKKKTELFCSEKDAYRVSLYEYALERQPCVLPIPGMASRIVTYAREKSAAAAAQALKNAAGTPDADTVFMSPDEPPPLHAGDLEANGKPLSVMESHVYAAPCVRSAPPTTDFLLVRNGNHMYVREIDSIITLGITEPKVEVMAPNTERFKKYSRERSLLWVLREFSRIRKDITRQQKTDKRGNKDSELSLASHTQPSIDKETILREFARKRTYPETWLLKMVKEFARYHNGKYTMIEEPSKGLAVREAEVLRTITPQETAAFESMESGWENLISRGIQIFTHPVNQGNIIAAAERSGLEAGPAVGAYIKNQLLKSPWYRSQNIMSAQKQQRKELLQALSLARIVNDLKEGGAVMESRLMSLTAAEMNNVLTNQYRLNTRKIPTDLEERRVLVREMAQRKGKAAAQDLSDYAALIRNVLKKHRTAAVGKTTASAPQGTTTSAAGTWLGMELELQRRALEDGDVDGLPVEDDDVALDADAAAVLAATGDDAFGEMPATKNKDARNIPNKRTVKKPKPQKRAMPATPMTPQEVEDAQEQAELKKLLSSSTMKTKPSTEPKEQIDEQKKKSKKRVTKLKVTKKVADADGNIQSVVTTVTDPEEIARLLEKKKDKSVKRGPESAPAATPGNLKIAIDMRRLQAGTKGAARRKPTTLSEKKKGKKKAPLKGTDAVKSPVVRKVGEKGQIGKIKISTKQIRKEKEQAALKRKRSQYGDEIDHPAKKTAKTSRRKRNGTVQLNNILEKIEKTIRETDGYVTSINPPLTIERLRDGESPPVGIQANNLAAPKGIGLDFTIPVDTKLVPTYKQVVKEQMYLNLIRQKCKRMAYQSVAEFRADVELLVNNARAFNRSPDVHWVVQHAELLLEVAVEQMSRRADEIAAAEEMVKAEKADAKAGSAGPSAAKSNPKKLKSKKGQGSSKKKGSVPPVVVIADSSDQEADDKPITIADQDAPSPSEAQDSANAVVPAESPAKETSPPASSSLFDAGMTDDIYSLDGPVIMTEGVEEDGQRTDNLVLDLDDDGRDR